MFFLPESRCESRELPPGSTAGRRCPLRYSGLGVSARRRQLVFQFSIDLLCFQEGFWPVLWAGMDSLKDLRPRLKKAWADLIESDYLHPQKSGFWWAENNNSLVFRPFLNRFWTGIDNCPENRPSKRGLLRASLDKNSELRPRPKKAWA